jgi:predicted lipoprotein with Yx(FWY)xxD motif
VDDRGDNVMIRVPSTFLPRLRHGGLGGVALLVGATLAACSSNASGGAETPRTNPSSPSVASSSSAQPGTMFSTAHVSGLGTVVVDAQGRTVYILTSGGHVDLPCTDATLCTKVWPDLPLPSGTSAAKAGPGIDASLLGTMKLSDGQTYPTYNGWLMYEYVGDSGPGQTAGQGIRSYGGIWYALNPSGNPITAGASGS